MQRVCSWCESRLGIQVPGIHPVTHVLCDPCLRELMVSVQRGPGRPERQVVASNHVRGSRGMDAPGPLTSGPPAEAA
jgi:hypothetical protein